MQYLSDWEVRNIRMGIEDMIYSGEAQIIRLEWFGTDTSEGTVYVARSGGSIDTLTTGYNKYFRDTPQTIEDASWYLYTEDNISAYIHIVDEFDTRQFDNQKIVIGDTLIYMKTSLNLYKRDKLRVVHLLDTEKITGTGTGSGSNWLDESASWDTNKYKGFWLVFSDRRFLITANTGTQLTVNLDGYTLPASGSYTIQPCIEYSTKIINPDLADGLSVPLGDEIPFQVLVCERIEQSGVK